MEQGRVSGLLLFAQWILDAFFPLSLSRHSVGAYGLNEFTISFRFSSIASEYMAYDVFLFPSMALGFLVSFCSDHSVADNISGLAYVSLVFSA